MAITNSREFTINVGKIADAEKWLSEGADLWKEITGKDGRRTISNSRIL